MRWKKLLNHPLTASLPSLGILLALAAAAGSTRLAPDGLFPRPGEMAGLLLVATLAALHQPLASGSGPSLGLATLVLPLAFLRLGAAPAAIIAGLAALAAEIWRGFARRRSASRGERGGRLGRNLEGAALYTGAVLVAGAWWGSRVEPGPLLGWWLIDPAAAYLVALLLLRAAQRALRARPQRTTDLRSLLPLGVDAAGWTLGGLLCDTAVRGGWGRVAVLTAVLALVIAEASRNAFELRLAELRLADLESLQHAHKRILAETSGMGGIAQQILVECRNVLPVQWFQFELLSVPPGVDTPRDGTSPSWSAGPDGVLVEGAPQPADRPRILPGVHRRVSWRVLEKTLEAENEDGRRETLAIVRLWCDPRHIEAGAEELFSSLVPQMASSVHRARLDREARLDALTGVPVRRILESRLQQAYSACCEQGWSMAVIMCDIDHFKKVNDTHGHAAGDEALRVFAQTLETHRRENDLCCRYGGEEFTLLLENTDGEAALNLAERLRLAVEAVELEYEGQRIPLTFSAGAAAFPELYIKTGSELLLLADEALYEAKEKGRNRCLLHLGRGAFLAPAGRTVGIREKGTEPKAPHFFG